LKDAIERITAAAEKADLELRWQQAEGDPVALVSIRPPRDEKKRVLRIESIKLGDGEVYLAGSSEGSEGSLRATPSGFGGKWPPRPRVARRSLRSRRCTLG